MRYQEYLEAYNSPNESAKSHFYAEDCQFQFRDLKLSGRKPIMAMFAKGHIGVKEELRPIHVLETDTHILAELDACFMPFEDTPDNLIYPFKKLQPISFRFFASYEIRDNQIHSFRLAHWPQPTAIEPF
ncbi:hypothetical protein CTAM01_08702 [Colletotrichum tamarilloi]|uniref:SnoaL-like domain-containing protein n=1 Tax=Colletotrichum tamarilloi TaxID=1209934 RepID=A0ABQ9R5F9_9PEZI|nr:uncharacterized protein CTAM01_08702 [Colletotrichum tamarilloi]KAI3545571.1 hypothetical protein CSPX01_04877 [Colletotrichum filicis]KAK1495247.1 hypothetical protein CTAM01_08702 [Colletotrichum tamarilloi]